MVLVNAPGLNVVLSQVRCMLPVNVLSRDDQRSHYSSVCQLHNHFHIKLSSQVSWSLPRQNVNMCVMSDSRGFCIKDTSTLGSTLGIKIHRLD